MTSPSQPSLPRPSVRPRLIGHASVILAVLVSALVAGASSASVYTMPVEAYAKYEPQKKCVTKDKPGTVMLARYLVDSRGGVFGGTLRSCGSGGQSEHKDGRAFDWMLDATSDDDQAVAEAFIVELTADNELGDTDALGRRMGVMYVIWDDKIYSAWYGFEPRPYLHAACRSVSTCSKTLRHRDHMHISLGKKASRAKTSWYVETQAAASLKKVKPFLRKPIYTPVID